MKPTTEDIKKFQELYRKRFCKEISFDDAYTQGSKLVHLLSIICKEESLLEGTPYKLSSPRRNNDE